MQVKHMVGDSYTDHSVHVFGYICTSAEDVSPQGGEEATEIAVDRAARSEHQAQCRRLNPEAREDEREEERSHIFLCLSSTVHSFYLL